MEEKHLIVSQTNEKWMRVFLNVVLLASHVHYLKGKKYLLTSLLEINEAEAQWIRFNVPQTIIINISSSLVDFAQISAE